MKFGTIWFLHLDVLIKISRWAVAVCFVIGFIIPIASSLFVLAWTLFALFLAITLITFFIHFPNDEKILKMISDYEKDFQEKLTNEFRNYQKAKVTTLQCFAVDKKRSLSRWIGKKKIYSKLVVLAWVETKEELWLIRNEKSLSHDRPSHITRYKIDSKSEIKSEIGAEDDDGMVNWSLKVADESFRFCCKEDYHLRDFLKVE